MILATSGMVKAWEEWVRVISLLGAREGDESPTTNYERR